MCSYFCRIYTFETPICCRLTQKHLFLDTDFMLQLIAALEARAAPPSKPPVESDAEEDVDPEVAPGEGKGETPDDSSKSGSVKKKPVYSYGAKPFIPFAGHLIQLAKVCCV